MRGRQPARGRCSNRSAVFCASSGNLPDNRINVSRRQGGCPIMVVTREFDIRKMRGLLSSSPSEHLVKKSFRTFFLRSSLRLTTHRSDIRHAHSHLNITARPFSTPAFRESTLSIHTPNAVQRMSHSAILWKGYPSYVEQRMVGSSTGAECRDGQALGAGGADQQRGNI
ncbi:hypothetical protein K505DRAFT_8836 [Melanomma pulvis-pyrius CBS 109.77]|uniref:Uncharacterized protein n=1 Tax=Melanomma pulvis-pyrius CBS 109.77 TaxID=1314802 RepID=A0A6A6XH83_9PLEO|nr:hypothetical protein K505DRAFT_8836 [Melanomma pulvis-pyrius CBS 109.77]